MTRICFAVEDGILLFFVCDHWLRGSRLVLTLFVPIRENCPKFSAASMARSFENSKVDDRHSVHGGELGRYQLVTDRKRISA